MANDGIVIKIDGDASALESSVSQSAERVAAAAEKAVAAAEKAAQAAERAVEQAAQTAADAVEDAGEAAEQAGEKAEQAAKESASGTKEAGEEAKDAGKKAKEAGEEGEKAGKKGQDAAQKVKAGLADVKAGIDMAITAVKAVAEIAGKGIDYNATMESYRTSFEVMTGSAEKAAEVVERLRTMGAETPFETTDLVQTTQLLMQYGFTADDAIEKMTMLGDIAQGDAEKMNSIALGYAQMSSAGKVNLQDIKQMIDICHTV